MFTIYPLWVGTTTRDNTSVEYLRNPGAMVDLPVTVFYITDGRRKGLIDTGGTPADGVSHMPYRQEADQFPDKKLEEMGVSCREIEFVIHTHLHWDHCSNNHLFPNARFYVQRRELQYAAAPLPIHKGLYDPRLIFATDYEILDGDTAIMEGVDVALTPGHSPGSQSVLVKTDGGVYAIAGDFVNTYYCWEASPRVVNGLHLDIAEYYRSYEKLAGLCDHVLPGHDLKVVGQKQYPMINEV